MKKQKLIHWVVRCVQFNVVALLATLLLAGSAKAQTLITGQAILNPYFETNFDNWNLTNGFYGDSGSRIAYAVAANSGNLVGFAVATGTGYTGSAIATANSLDASTCYLKGFDFTQSQPWFYQIGPWGSINGQYNLYFEVKVTTLEGKTYQADSNTFNALTTANGAMTLNFNWDGALGDIKDANGGLGLALSDVTGISYAAVMETLGGINTLGGNTFVTLDNMSLIYQVSTVPEASSYAMIACAMGLLGGLQVLRGRRIS